jgi:small-conductance mechanosensitive channel
MATFLQRAAVAAILAALAALTGPLSASSAHAQAAGTAPAVRPDHQAEDLGRLIDLARERGEEIVIRVEPAAHGAGPPTAATFEASLFRGWKAVGGMFMAGLAKGIEGIGLLPQFASDFTRAWRDMHNASSSLEAVTRIAVVFGGGLLFGWLARRVVRALVPCRYLMLERFAARLVDAFRGTLADACGLVVLVLSGDLLRGLLLPQADLAEFIALDLNRAVVWVGCYWLGARLLLSPERPEARLLPIRNPAWHFRMLVIYAFIGSSIYASSSLIEHVAGGPVVVGWLLIMTTGVLCFKLGWFWTARADFAAVVRVGAGDNPHFMTRLAGALAAWVLMAVALANWFVTRLAAVTSTGVWMAVAAGITQIAAALLPIIGAGADILIAEALGSHECEGSPLRKATVAVGRALSCGGVWIIGLVGLADLWGVNLMMPGASIAESVWRVTVTIGVAVVVGWALWRFASVYLAGHAPQSRPVLPGVDEDSEPPAQSRLATALPLVRSVILGVVVGVTALVVLSALGIDIGPLLAGFGVIGLAFSFGSQALVRDIMSGIFFMADDAFRVGEYIDTGRLKGTVEKISVRSVQLRHQSGLVHTIPFGQLQAITNASRDWSTVKFNIRLERGIDVEQTRKVIKRVGQEMQEDAELAPEIILPLKLQGVADITEGAIVCRLKITARPARASWVQREALKRVYRALEAGGIAFASGAVTVKSQADPDRAAIGAAANAGVSALRPPREVAT